MHAERSNRVLRGSPSELQLRPAWSGHWHVLVVSENSRPAGHVRWLALPSVHWVNLLQMVGSGSG